MASSLLAMAFNLLATSDGLQPILAVASTY